MHSHLPNLNLISLDRNRQIYYLPTSSNNESASKVFELFEQPLPFYFLNFLLQQPNNQLFLTLLFTTLKDLSNQGYCNP